MPDFGADGLMPDIPETWNKETEYILDFTKGYHNLLQREEDGNVQSYVWDSGALFMEEEGESYSYLNDLSGSVMRLSGNGRDSAAAYRYDEFGTDLSGNQGKFHPFGYTGYQRDAVAGTYYAQAREYDTWSGRFTSEDVVKGNAAYPETLNAYGYCWGNPVKYVDRDGEFSISAAILIAGVIGIAIDLVFQTIDNVNNGVGIVFAGNFGVGALTSFFNDYMADTDKNEMMEQINI